MNEPMQLLQKRKKIFTAIIIVSLVIAYLADLGYPAITYKTDEPRRALVAMEMMFSGNYLTPTIQGEIYLNKPPLYNWIIAFYFYLFQNFSAFALRLPVIVATAGIGITTYFFVKKYTDKTIAFLTAMAFVTNGRILIYESLQGLIDVTLAWVIYLMFMLVYYYGQKEKYWQLFISTWALAAIGFLMKGLPALAFEGITLLTYFIWQRKFSKLFSTASFAGFAVFILLLSAYYIPYFSSNNITPMALFSNLLNESSKRTVVQFGIWKTILHIITFPFELLYHFAPWTIFILMLFRKNISAVIKANPFIEYCFLTLITNMIAYWSSPEVYARYLFMFVPLMFVILIYVYKQFSHKNDWQAATLNRIIQYVCAAVCLLVIALPFIPFKEPVQYLYPKLFLLLLLFGASAFIAFKYPAFLMYSFLFSLAVFRIGFNWFVVEQRGQKDFVIQNFSNKISAVTKGKPLHILRGAQVGNMDAICFETGIQRREIVKFANSMRAGEFYIADRRQLQHASYTSYLNFYSLASDSLYLVKFNKSISHQ